ncbi:SdrD B-like domain-containing protein [Aeoliella sp. SH292]|uniref:SdrD B-like domain-containing protein n=1 Tax=Aeoliella sp. SH292 TaxID=3454464 RepID=UPI003F9C95C1
MPTIPFGWWQARVLCGALCVLLLPAMTFAQNSQIGGWVYVDRNNDGALNFSSDPMPELVIPDVTVNLYQLVNANYQLLSTLQTSDQGRYQFNNLGAGTYRIEQIQPVGWLDGLDTIGSMTLNGTNTFPPGGSLGTVSNNLFSGIVLPGGSTANFYNFGERGMLPGYVSKRYLFASAPPMPEAQITIPEPSSIAMLVGAIVGGVALRGRRRRLACHR